MTRIVWEKHSALNNWTLTTRFLHAVIVNDYLLRSVVGCSSPLSCLTKLEKDHKELDKVADEAANKIRRRAIEE